MSKKIGLAIVTYTINYGTYLQAFATQYAVRKLGYETEIINIDSVISDVSKARTKYFLSRLLDFSEVFSLTFLVFQHTADFRQTIDDLCHFRSEHIVYVFCRHFIR